jgi:hypothetical protein
LFSFSHVGVQVPGKCEQSPDFGARPPDFGARHSLGEGRSLTASGQVQSHCLDFSPHGSLSVVRRATLRCANVGDLHPSVTSHFIDNVAELTLEKRVEVIRAVDLNQIAQSILKRHPQGGRFR